ncbi:hypothetical protein ACO0K7_04405 [Undibacterium sp. Ji67W]|uniref:hypothetical protein n=1 Tax=Undibacterium sp. Ji67W TaxID=3413042 RepID=UPI003BF04BA7
MKTSTKTRAFFATALFAGVLAVGNAFTVGAPAVQSQSAAIPSVVITAQRMSEDQKLAFDAEQSGLPTVVISAKRLTAEQKLAMDQDAEYASQIAAKNSSHSSI